MNELRPRTFNDYIGQEDAKELLRISCASAKKRHEPMDHVLLYGFPGLGKTTLTQAVAHEMGADIKIVEAPTLKKTSDLATLIMDLNDNDILFIDEIHALPKNLEEMLYPAVEDREIIVPIQKRLVRMKTAKFTLIGATTRLDLISQPLRDRFGVVCQLQYYSLLELDTIIENSSRHLGMKITSDATRQISICSRGTARVANQILKRCRDTALVKNSNIDSKIVNDTLRMLKIDDKGFTDTDKKIISVLKSSNKAIGLNNLATMVGVNPESLLTVYEPYLIKEGVITVTPKGRMIV